jgi:hypothetical protein
MDFAL